jgi:F-type H+-transporting ATPase subunit b
VLNFTVTFFITIANIAILVLILKKLLFKPVQKFMAERTRKVKEEIDGAAVTRHSAEELKARYEKLLAEAEKESEAIVKEAEERGKEEAKAILAAAEAEAAEIRRRAEERAEYELARARDELAGEVALIALAAASKVAGRSIGGADDLAEAEAFVRGFGVSRG